ncbi:hypothetical protein GALMADRAFT_148663 [Galerina marginata CBS 339.88]|uniref:Uncharacterized protein n=1 Tax=Galerina marginata (strain CBS 339.88) TaxID=685588 RepID=A0A067SCP0_GALM3|nr:hypothetical protein GALMADRAFT_148663 [Galerina marginata CBS 339.88]
MSTTTLRLWFPSVLASADILKPQRLRSTSLESQTEDSMYRSSKKIIDNEKLPQYPDYNSITDATEPVTLANMVRKYVGGVDLPECEECFLKEARRRFVLFPIQYPEIWQMYMKAEASFWTAEEMDLFNDDYDWANCLDDNQRHFISHVLTFFAASDGIVNENPLECSHNEVQAAEACCFYGIQRFPSNATTSSTPSRLFHVPCAKLNALKWISEQPSFGGRLVALAALEGIFFSGSFVSILWLKKGGFMPGLVFSNELISTYEGMHTDFACLLFSHLKRRPHLDTIEMIITEVFLFNVRDNLNTTSVVYIF